MRRILFFLFLFYSFNKSFAQVAPLILEENIPDCSLNNYCEYFEEEDEKGLSLNQVVSPDFQKKFVHGLPKSKRVRNGVWIKFSLKNNSSINNLWLIRSFNHAIPEMKFYSPLAPGKYLVSTVGFDYPFETRPFFYREFQFKIPYAPNLNTYYLRVKPGRSFVFNFHVSNYQYFFKYSINEYYIFGIFLGIFLIVFVYNMILFFSLRERAYLYYCLYVICICLFALFSKGLFFQYFWNEPLWWARSLYKYSFTLSTICLLLYSKSFLDTRTHLPKLDKILNSLIVIRLSIIVLERIFAFGYYLYPYVDFCFLILAFFVVIKRYRQGFVPARFFILGYTMLLISVAIYVSQHMGIQFPRNFLVLNGVFIAAIGDVVLFSVALADRFRSLKKEKENALQSIIEQLKENELLKDKVNRELEQKVQERTEQIRFQSEEIERINEILKEHNKALEGNVKDLSKARVMQKTVTYEEFQQIYPDEETCFKFLAELKWGEGFECKKCSNKNYSSGKALYSRKCTRCRYIESVTSGTIFNKLKFPIVKAFYLLFLVSSGKDHTADELSRVLSLRRVTCWMFKKKVVEIMDGRKNFKKQKEGWKSLILLTESERLSRMASEEEPDETEQA